MQAALPSWYKALRRSLSWRSHASAVRYPPSSSKRLRSQSEALITGHETGSKLTPLKHPWNFLAAVVFNAAACEADERQSYARNRCDRLHFLLQISMIARVPKQVRQITRHTSPAMSNARSLTSCLRTNAALISGPEFVPGMYVHAPCHRGPRRIFHRSHHTDADFHGTHIAPSMLPARTCI